MSYEVRIDAFEGPLDLLLHLLKEAKVNIYDIKISEITQQYLDYIHAMEELKLEIASEYLVMAATLIEIKSKSLLPKQVVEIEDEYEEDSREESRSVDESDDLAKFSNEDKPKDIAILDENGNPIDIRDKDPEDLKKTLDKIFNINKDE